MCDAMLRIGLPVKNLRGQSYDGAANMSGRFQGRIQAIIGEKATAGYSLYRTYSAHITA